MNPARGEIWYIDLNPIRGREQAGRRPCLVISVDQFNHGPSELVVILPITSKKRNIPFHVSLYPPEGSLQLESYIKCEDVRSASRDRLLEKVGRISNETMRQVEDRLRILMDL